MKKINIRKVFVITIIAICVISVNLAVFFTIIKKEDKKLNSNEEVIIDTVELGENFQNIFDNTITMQQNEIAFNKLVQNQPMVYTKYEKVDTKNQLYNISIHIPYININHPKINEINQEITDLFYQKVMSIITQTSQTNTVYSIDYKAYVNDNILSLVIRSNLKEGNNAQRVIIKTYNYNLSSNEILDINKVIEYRGLDRKQVQNKIHQRIEEIASSASAYQELGYEKYLRNKNDTMYLIENTKVFFLGENKALYILYPYGNSNYTSELDLIVI